MYANIITFKIYPWLTLNEQSLVLVFGHSEEFLFFISAVGFNGGVLFMYVFSCSTGYS